MEKIRIFSFGFLVHLYEGNITLSLPTKVLERYQVLFAIYDLTKGYRIQHVWLSQIRDYLELSESKEDELLKICTYLKNEGLIEFKYLGPGIVISNYGIKEIEESILHPTKDTINFPAQVSKKAKISKQLLELVTKVRISRSEFLRELYDITTGDESIMVNSVDVAKNIEMDEAMMNKVYWYLLDEGLIEFRYNGGGISITHLGIKLVEDARQLNPPNADYVSKIGLNESPKYRNDLPIDINWLLDLSVEDLVKEDESSCLEFKSSLCWDYNESKPASKDLQLDIVKAIPAFMNSNGGLLVIGIDKDNESVLGLNKDFQILGKDGNLDRWRLLLSDILYKRHQIDLIVSSEYVQIIKRSYAGETIAVIIVKKSPNAVWLVHNNHEKFYIRNDNRTISLEGRQLVQYIKVHFG